MNTNIIIEREPTLNLKDTFQKARERIADMGDFDPPLTFKELRHVYDATRYSGCIFLRCTYNTPYAFSS